MCCHHLLQVTWQNLTAGAVIITVQGFNIPMGPQNYSLVAQGQFSGQLQSPYNPAWAPNAVPGNCSLPVAQITASPHLITNHTSPRFNFTTAADPAPNGFECKLSGFVTTGVTGVIHDWITCTSPRRERNLTDGRYLFEVRAKGAVLSTVQASALCHMTDSAASAVALQVLLGGRLQAWLALLHTLCIPRPAERCYEGYFGCTGSVHMLLLLQQHVNLGTV